MWKLTDYCQAISIWWSPVNILLFNHFFKQIYLENGMIYDTYVLIHFIVAKLNKYDISQKNNNIIA